MYFPRIVDEAFFNRTGLEHVGVVGLEFGLLLGWAGLQVLASLSFSKMRKKKGWRGLRTWPLQCLSQFLPDRKDRLLKGRIFCIPFTEGVA